MTENIDENNIERADDYINSDGFNVTKIADYLNVQTGLQSNFISTLLNNDSSLRNQIIDRVNNGLHEIIKSKKFIGNVEVPFILSTEQILHLQTSFENLNIKFTKRAINDHAYAASSRICERAMLLNKIGYDLKINKNKIFIKDVGGDIVTSTLSQEYNIHCCMPLIDAYDSTRYANRIQRARRALAQDSFRSEYQVQILKNFSDSFSKSINTTEHFCLNKSQECNIKAESLLFLHSNYDIKLREIGNMMDTAEALVGYGSFIYHSTLLTVDKGLIPWLDAEFSIQRDSKGSRKSINFGFKNCHGFNYVHDYKTYMDYLIKSQFRSDSNNRFSIELLENIDGIQFFRITRMLSVIGHANLHRLPLVHLANKYIVRFPFFSYDKDYINQQFIQYTSNDNLIYNTSFWKNLPKLTKWKTLIVDRDIIDRTCAFVLGNTEEKFKPESIIVYLRSITTREVMYNSVAKKRDNYSFQDLCTIAHAVYVTLYHAKYVYGKGLQQAIANTNALRSGTKSNDFLSEFDQYQNKGLLKKFLEWFGFNDPEKFNPSLFICEPLPYLEIVTDENCNSRVYDNTNIADINIDDVIIVEKEAEKINSLLKPDTTLEQNDIINKVIYKPKGCGFNNIITGDIVDWCDEVKEIEEVQNIISYDTNVYEEVEILISDDEQDFDFATKITGKDIFGISNVITRPLQRKIKNKNKKCTIINMVPLKKIDIGEKQKVIEQIIENTDDINKQITDKIKQLPEINGKIINEINILNDHNNRLFENTDDINKQITDKVIKQLPEITGKIINENNILNDYNNRLLKIDKVVTADSNVSSERLNYPRLGIYDAIEDTIDVDGSRLECCFIALTDNRIVDYNLLRRTLLSMKPNNKELQEETTPGKMAGLAVIEMFSKKYNVIVQIHENSNKHVVKPDAYTVVTRVINLVLKNDHYYIKNMCNENYKIKVISRNMYTPINMLEVKSYLKQRFPINVLKNIERITEKNSSYLFYNNLMDYCMVHEECGNNNLRKVIKNYSTIENHKVNLIVLFETNNFSISLLQSIMNDYPIIGFRFLDINNNNYFGGLISYRSALVKIDYNKSFNIFKEHKCNNGVKIDYDMNNDILYTCRKVRSAKILTGKADNPDVTINLNFSKNHNIQSSVTCNTVNINCKGENGHCENIVQVAKYIMSYYGTILPNKSVCVQLNSDFSNVKMITDRLSNLSEVLFVNISKSVTFDDRLNVDFEPDYNTLSRQRNSMREVYALWYNEKSVIEVQLEPTYCRLLKSIKNNEAVDYLIDNTVALFDLNKARFIFGKPNPPYQWGFSKKLIYTEGLFKDDGVNSNICKELVNNGHSYVLFNSNTKLVNGVIMSQNFSVNDANNVKEKFTVKFVEGVPGAGKTEYILEQNKNKSDNLILTVTKAACEDMVKRASSKQIDLDLERIKTIDSVLINLHDFGTVDEVWIDEALLSHAGAWLYVMYYTNAKKLVVVGDRAQIPYIVRNGKNTLYHLSNSWDINEKIELSLNRRNPLDIVKWLDSGNFYKFQVKGTSNHYNSVNLVKISSESDIPIDDNTKYLTFTQSEKQTLKNKGFNYKLINGEDVVNTIHEYQGNQNSKVALVRINTKEADTIYKSINHILVALTRHKEKFTYYTVLTNDETASQIKKIKSYNKGQLESVKGLKGGGLITDISKVFTKKPDYAVPLYLQNNEIKNLVIKNEGSGYVPWFFNKKTQYNDIEIPEVVNTRPLGYNVLQEFIDYVLPGSSTEFREYDHYNFEFTEQPVSYEGISIEAAMPRFKKYDYLNSRLRTSIQYPLHQSQKVTIKAFNERNGQVPNLQGFIDPYFEATQLINDFDKLLVRREKFHEYPITINIKSTDRWIRNQPPAVLKIINSEPLFWDNDFTLYDFIVKAIPKIDLEIGAEYRYKAPQTICFQSKTINSVFCPILKDMMDRVNYSLHDDIVFYNEMSAEEFAQSFTDRMPHERYSLLPNFLEIDFSKYDKSQGLLILIFEALLMERFGVPIVYIKLWILMHRITFLVDRFSKVRMSVEYQRKSGDAGTWRLNTLVQLAVLNRVMRLYEYFLNGNCVACFSGDDSLIFLNEKIYDIDRKTFNLQTVYNLEAKIMNYNIPYFCSKFLLLSPDGWIFVPDTLKLIVKLGRNDLVDFEHVECYRISFEDNIKPYRYIENWNFISQAINDRYKITGEHDMIYMSLLELASNRDRFSELYFQPKLFIKGKHTIKPKLDI